MNIQKIEDQLYLKPSITNPVPGMTLCAGIPSSAMSSISAHVYLTISSKTVFKNIASTTTKVKTRIALSNFTSTQKSCHKSHLLMRSNGLKTQGGLRLLRKGYFYRNMFPHCVMKTFHMFLHPSFSGPR